MPALMEIKTWGSHPGCEDLVKALENKTQVTYCFWDSPDLQMGKNQALKGNRQISHVNCISMRNHFQSNTVNYEPILHDFLTPHPETNSSRYSACLLNPPDPIHPKEIMRWAQLPYGLRNKMPSMLFVMVLTLQGSHFQSFSPKPWGLGTLFQKLNSQESHLIIWTQASRKKKRIERKEKKIKKKRGEGGKGTQNTDTQRFMAKNAIVGKTLIVPNFFLFPFLTCPAEECIFFPLKYTMCCNPVLPALIFLLLK